MKSLEIVKKEENNTLFILDRYKRFFIRINYYDYLHKEFPSMYDINISEDSLAGSSIPLVSITEQKSQSFIPVENENN